LRRCAVAVDEARSHLIPDFTHTTAVSGKSILFLSAAAGTKRERHIVVIAVLILEEAIRIVSP
jgi:hypothetical protein